MTQKTLFDHDLTLEEAKELIRNGANVNEKKLNDYTPLFFVNDYQIAQLLIKHGADVNARDNYNFSPIFYKQNIEIIELFINHGALLNIRDIHGLSPLDKLAEFEKCETSAKLLITHGAIAGTRDGYQTYRNLFTQEQQEAFDTFLSLTSNDNEFFQMCLAYLEGVKNNVTIKIKDMGII